MKKEGFKGFDKNLKCRHFQFEVGKEFKHEGEVSLCASGFHYCEHPLDVFRYYPPAMSRFASVEADGVSDNTDSDTKRVAKSIVIKAELTMHAMIAAAVKFVFDRADWSKKENHVTDKQGAASATGDQGAASATGEQGAASATGEQGAASATGVRGAASATGYQGAASATGEQGAASATGVRGAAVSLGLEAKAKGAVGCWLTIAEWKIIGAEWHRVNVKTTKVDGKRIKADTFYSLKNGKFTIAS